MNTLALVAVGLLLFVLPWYRVAASKEDGATIRALRHAAPATALLGGTLLAAHVAHRFGLAPALSF